MSGQRYGVPASTDRVNTPRRLAGVLCLLGLWTAAVPYVGRILDIDVDVPAWIEVIDHVVPGAVVTTLAGWLLHQTPDRPRTSRWRHLGGAGGCILAGTWIFMNHLKLLMDAAHGEVAWYAALWHAGASVAIIAVSVAYLFAVADPVQSKV